MSFEGIESGSSLPPFHRSLVWSNDSCANRIGEIANEHFYSTADFFSLLLTEDFPELPLIDLLGEIPELIPIVEPSPAMLPPAHLYTPAFCETPAEQDNTPSISSLRAPSDPYSLDPSQSQKILVFKPPYTIVLQNSHLFIKREDIDPPNSFFVTTNVDPNVRVRISENFLATYSPIHKQLEVIKVDNLKLKITHIFRNIEDFDLIKLLDNLLFMQRDNSLEIYNTSTMEMIAIYEGVTSYLVNPRYLVLNCSRIADCVHIIKFEKNDLHQYTLSEHLSMYNTVCYSLSDDIITISQPRTFEFQIYDLSQCKIVLERTSKSELYLISRDNQYLMLSDIDNRLLVYHLSQKKFVFHTTFSAGGQALINNHHLFCLNDNRLSVINLISLLVELRKENVQSFLIIDNLLISTTLKHIHAYNLLLHKELLTKSIKQIASASTMLYVYNEMIYVQIDDTTVEKFTLDFTQHPLPPSKKKSKTHPSKERIHLSLKTPITHHFKKTRKIQRFLKRNAGKSFVFSKALKEYVASHPNGNLGDIVHKWKNLRRQ